MSTATSPAPQFRLRRAPRSARRPHAGSDRDRRHDPQVSPGARPAARQGSASAPSRRVIVIVECSTGRLGCRVFFSTEATLDVVNVLETYAGRWGIEVFFREAKQLLGFADSQARKQAAVLRVAPLVGLLYSGLVLWFAEAALCSPLASLPYRPWYTHKCGFSFADILRTARRALADIDVLVPLSRFEEFVERRLMRGAPANRPELARAETPDGPRAADAAVPLATSR